jgi:hypothetical protein
MIGKIMNPAGHRLARSITRSTARDRSVARAHLVAAIQLQRLHVVTGERFDPFPEWALPEDWLIRCHQQFADKIPNGRPGSQPGVQSLSPKHTISRANGIWPSPTVLLTHTRARQRNVRATPTRYRTCMGLCRSRTSGARRCIANKKLISLIFTQQQRGVISIKQLRSLFAFFRHPKQYTNDRHFAPSFR